MTDVTAPLDDLHAALRALQLIAGPDAAKLMAGVVSDAWAAGRDAPDPYRPAVAAAILADAARQLRSGDRNAEADTIVIAAGVFGRAFRNALTMGSLRVPDYPPSSA